MHWTWIEAGVWLLVGLVAALTILAAFLLWRNGYVRGWRAARNNPPCCPRCGYNLSGLTHCRCPECGEEYQLEDLWRSAVMPKRTKSDDQTERPNGRREEST